MQEVSSLGAESHARRPSSGLGIENASFVWNSVAAKSSEDDKKLPTAEQLVTENVEDGRKFELKDINVMFPDGELSLITGPTASGKTALLVRISLFALCFGSG